MVRRINRPAMPLVNNAAAPCPHRERFRHAIDFHLDRGGLDLCPQTPARRARD